MRKRLLALGLVLVMLLGSLSAQAMAQEASSCTHDDASWGCYPGDYHYLQCFTCGQTLVEGAAHTFENGVCTVCGKAYCDHAQFTWRDNLGCHAKQCDSCQVLFEEWDPHVDGNGDSVCDVCGAAVTVCAHATRQNYFTESLHYVFCDDCGQELIAWGPHFMENDSCSVCGFTPCKDGHSFLSEAPHLCVKCDLTSSCLDEDGDCVCDQCGSEWHGEVFLETDENVHRNICAGCGNVLLEEAHFDSDNMAGCDACNYGCPHQNEQWLIYTDFHQAWCGHCGQEIVPADFHSGEGDTCDICGAKPCENGHTIGTGEEPHLCDVCKCYVYCGTDDNNDCACDACGLYNHIYLISFNETQHKMRCFRCGESTAWENHSDTGAGICDVCCYGCPHENLGWFMSHAAHGNFCRDCGVWLDNMDSHIDANGDNQCDKCTMEDPHIWKTVAEVPATCQTEGVKAHYTCDVCQYLWLEKADISTEKQLWLAAVAPEELLIPKTAHDPELRNVKTATCVTKGYSGDEVCKVCDTVVKTGAETELGLHAYVEGVCTVCQMKDPVYVKVETSQDVPPVKTDIPTQELLTEEDKTAIEQGAKVEIELSVENAEETVAAETKQEVEDVVAEINANNKPAEGGDETGDTAPETKVGMYLDINLTKTVGEEKTPITQTEAKVEISVEVPSDLQNSEENIAREFFVLRFHEGQVDQLEDIDNDPNTVTFETDRFSTYVLIYTDKPIENPVQPSDPEPSNPVTGDEDNLLAYTALLMISLLGLAVLVTNKKTVR